MLLLEVTRPDAASAGTLGHGVGFGAEDPLKASPGGVDVALRPARGGRVLLLVATYR
jgi:hypothetical protein